MTRGKHRNLNICFIAGITLVAVFAVVHLYDVFAGTEASGYTWQIGRYAAVAVVGIAVCAVCGALIFSKNLRLELCFIPAALMLSLLYAYVLPPLSAPDEIRHYISAYQLSDTFMGIHSDDPIGRVLVRTQDWFAEDTTRIYIGGVTDDGIVTPVGFAEEESVPLGQVLTSDTYEELHEYAANGGKASDYDTLGDLAYSCHLPVNTTPVVYLAPAIGITLARLLGLNTIALLVLGRFFNLLLYCIVTFFAIKRIPFGKSVLFGVAILPMSLNLAASYSYDAPLMCSLWLFAAVCLDLAYNKEKVRGRDIVLLAVIMALAGPCKMVYAVMMGLCLLIPLNKFGGKGRWAISAVAVAGAWVLAMILVNGQTVAAYASGTENYIEWAGEEGYTMAMALHHPLKALKMAYDTVLYQGGYWVSMMIGSGLGNSDPVLQVPFIVVLSFGVGLIMMALRKPGESIRITAGNRIWIWCVCILCAGGLLFSMLIAWTPISSNMINGIQGRYFLPLLPVFLISLQNDTIVLTKDIDRSILYLMCCANVGVLVRIFAIVTLRVV